jgi:hypothetical protein
MLIKARVVPLLSLFPIVFFIPEFIRSIFQSEEFIKGCPIIIALRIVIIGRKLDRIALRGVS